MLLSQRISSGRSTQCWLWKILGRHQRSNTFLCPSFGLKVLFLSMNLWKYLICDWTGLCKIPVDHVLIQAIQLLKSLCLLASLFTQILYRRIINSKIFLASGTNFLPALKILNEFIPKAYLYSAYYYLKQKLFSLYLNTKLETQYLL